MPLAVLPDDAVFSCLDKLPGYAKPWFRQVSKGCAQHLSKHTQISAKQPDLPFWLLKQYYTDNLATTADGTDTKQLKKKQAQLLAARAGAGDLAGVQWLRAQGCAWYNHSCVAAAEGGHLNVLSWLLSQRPRPPLDAGLCALAAASAGQVPVLDFLQAECLLRPFDLAQAGEAAAAAEKQAVLDWLVIQDSALAATAAAADHAAAATARQQVQQIMTFARDRAPPAVAVLA